MNLIISLCLAFVFSWCGAKWIKKHAKLIYAIATVLSIAVIAITYTNQVVNMPVWVSSYVWPIFANCSLATAFFIIVMMTGALPNGSTPIKRLMPIRAELSIMACILTLGHNIAYGKTYFVMLVTRPERLSGSLLWAALCSIALIVIMLPLMITSFTAVRKKMKGKSWKNLQRSAYVFYALIYIHVMLLNISFLAAGQTKYLFNIIVYSIVFITYAAMRVRKALLKKHPTKAKTVAALLAVAATLVVVIVCAPNTLSAKQKTSEQDNTEIQVIEETEIATNSKNDENQTTSQAVAKEEETTTNLTTSAVKYIDGTYFGTGEGFNGEIQVAVMVSGGEISQIIVVANNDDKSYFDKATALLDTIKASRSIDVDTVTGATYSSKGLIEAVKNALSLAEDKS